MTEHRDEVLVEVFNEARWPSNGCVVDEDMMFVAGLHAVASFAERSAEFEAKCNTLALLQTLGVIRGSWQERQVRHCERRWEFRTSPDEGHHPQPDPKDASTGQPGGKKGHS